jgi:signal transduction histidine kinase
VILKYKNDVLDRFEFKVYLSDFARLIINLLENSCQSLEEKILKNESFEPQIKVYYREETDKHILIFGDNGIGIKKEEINKIF